MISPTLSLSGRRVLVVEDDFYLATDSQDWLERAGATVVGPVGSADQAEPLLQDQPVDAAMIDINLGNGPTFALAASLSRQGVPFLFATGYDRDAIPAEFSDVPCLQKPFTGDALLRTLARITNGSSADIS